MSTEASQTEELVFRHTNAGTGRHLTVTPENSPMRHLAYGRIILNETARAARFENGARETVMVCLSGHGTVKVGGVEERLGPDDSIYIPRDSSIEVSTDSAVDFAEFSAEVEKGYPLKVVRASEVTKESGLKVNAGGPGAARTVSMLVTKNVEAGRLMVGITRSDPGNWTSWPPHEHAQMLEEMYVYFDMPAPAYGLQLVYKNTEYPEMITAVRDGDVVLMPSGYHPNVAVPGHQLNFLWALAAHREGVDRQYGVVNTQPEFGAAKPSPNAARN